MSHTTPQLTIYSPAETASRLRVSDRTLERWRMTGDGPAFVRIGRRVAYTDDAIDAYIRSRTVTHTRQPVA